MMPARSGMANNPEVFWENLVIGLWMTSSPSLMAGTRPARDLILPPIATTLATSVVSPAERNSGCASLNAFVSQNPVVEPVSTKKMPVIAFPSGVITSAWTRGILSQVKWSGNRWPDPEYEYVAGS